MGLTWGLMQGLVWGLIRALEILGLHLVAWRFVGLEAGQELKILENLELWVW